MTFTCPVLSGAVPVMNMLAPLLPWVHSYLSHCAVCPRKPHPHWGHPQHLLLPKRDGHSSHSDRSFICSDLPPMFLLYLPYDTQKFLSNHYFPTGRPLSREEFQQQQKKLQSCLKWFHLLYLKAAWRRRENPLWDRILQCLIGMQLPEWEVPNCNLTGIHGKSYA